MAQSTDMSLFSPTFKKNPYPLFAMLRANQPVAHVNLAGNRPAWLISRYDEAETVLKDQRFVKDARNALTMEEMAQFFVNRNNRPDAPRPMIFHRQMLNTDPPDHARLRTLVNIPFTPRMVEQWRGRIQAITDELLDAAQAKGEMELIGDFAFPLPITVITEMLGVPTSDRMKFRSWSNALIDASGNPEAFGNIRAGMQEFGEYLVKLINEKRTQTGDDLLNKLIQAESEGDKLSEEELVSMVFLLLVAGHETTVNLIGNGILALLQHPDQMELLKQDPALITSAVEEFLRYQGPLLTATQRWAREDVELAGQQIKRGDYVVVLLASANRDGEEFAQADELDITRKDNHHLAFGKGIHFCLGAPLARLEGQIAISTLLHRMPALRLNIDPDDLTWRSGALIMGLNQLPVAF